MTRPVPVDARPELLLPSLERALAGAGPAVLPVPLGAAARADALAAGHPGEPVDADVVAVVTTSGSTGDPKGVELTRTALRASAAATAQRLGGPAQWLLALDPTFVGGLQVLVRSVLAGTAPVVLDLAGGFRAEDFVRATDRLTGPRRLTSLVPTQLARLLDAGGAAVTALAAYDGVLLGAAAAPAGLLERAGAAGVRVVTTYGMSETCGGCVYDGRPLAGVGCALEHDGRIVLSGPVVAAGYRCRPELTAAAFTGGGFRTQDLGTLDAAGLLTVLGRVDDVVVTGGAKVSARAVEEALDAHPGVRASAVVGVRDTTWGHRLEAWVVAAAPAPGGEDLHEDELRATVRARLPREAVPRRVHLVDELPLLGSGKVDREALRRAAERLPG